MEIIKRTEFWIALLATIGAVFANSQGWITPEYAAIVATVSAAAYALSRGLAKYNNDLKRGWKTTEFWVGLVGAAVVVFESVSGNISADTVVILNSIIGVIYAISRGFAKMPEYETIDEEIFEDVEDVEA